MASPLHEQVRAGLRGLGFDEVRFAALPDADVGAGLGAWFDAGHHADMAWMERTRDKRADPTQVLPGARSIILLGVNYWMPDAPLAARVGATGAGQAEGHGGFSNSGSPAALKSCNSRINSSGSSIDQRAVLIQILKQPGANVIETVDHIKTLLPESATPGYTRVDLGLVWRLPLPTVAAPLTLFLQGRNLTDQDIRVHTSFLKGVAPPPGRSVVLGLRAAI
jgi:hypothetical protein